MSDSRSDQGAEPEARSSKPIDWRSLGIDVGTIIFSVLLALWVNAAWQERSDRKGAEFASERIGKELQLNRRSLDESRVYYRSMVDTIRPLLESPDELPKRLPGWNGLKPPILRDASYRVALAAGAFNHLEFRQAEDITHVYALQDMFSLLLNKYLDRLISRTSPKNADDLLFMLTMFTDLAALGDEVVRAYDQLIPEIVDEPPEFDDLTPAESVGTPPEPDADR